MNQAMSCRNLTLKELKISWASWLHGMNNACRGRCWWYLTLRWISCILGGRRQLVFYAVVLHYPENDPSSIGKWMETIRKFEVEGLLMLFTKCSCSAGGRWIVWFVIGRGSDGSSEMKISGGPEGNRKLGV